jgi:hypothetical protein
MASRNNVVARRVFYINHIDMVCGSAAEKEEVDERFASCFEQLGDDMFHDKINMLNETLERTKMSAHDAQDSAPGIPTHTCPPMIRQG